jgi:hypothetical protein
MGYYINPADCSKEEWLDKNGVEVTGSPDTLQDPSGERVPVCLMDNGPFTAASICYDRNEIDAFNQPGDYRLKRWFMVPAVKLAEVCPQVASKII